MESAPLKPKCFIGVVREKSWSNWSYAVISEHVGCCRLWRPSEYSVLLAQPLTYVFMKCLLRIHWIVDTILDVHQAPRCYGLNSAWRTFSLVLSWEQPDKYNECKSLNWKYELFAPSLRITELHTLPYICYIISCMRCKYQLSTWPTISELMFLFKSKVQPGAFEELPITE